MDFPRRVTGPSLSRRVRSLTIQEGLRVEPALLHVERSQLKLTKMPPGYLLGEVFQACPTGTHCPTLEGL